MTEISIELTMALPATPERQEKSIISRTKVRAETLPFARPDISHEEIDAVMQVMKSGWLTSGPQVQLFEEEFAKRVGAPHAIALNSATAALHLGMIAWNLTDQDAVIVPSITFTATAEVITYSGALPIILDVDRENYLLSPAILLDFLENKCVRKGSHVIHKESKRIVRGMIPVHLAGRPCEMDELQAIADSYGLRIIEDAAHAFPCSYKSKMVGSLSELTAFSFYATKNITTGEGGMLTTSNDALARRLRRVRLHGIKGQTYGRKRWHYDVVDMGCKYNMMDICAAMGRVQLKRSDVFHNKRKNIVNRYRESLGSIPGLRLPYPGVHEEALHLFTVELTGRDMTRDQFVEEMYERGIGTSLHFIPLYRHTYYRKKYKLKPSDYPNSEEIYRNIVSLPLYSAMKDQDVSDVIHAVREIAGG